MRWTKHYQRFNEVVTLGREIMAKNPDSPIGDFVDALQELEQDLEVLAAAETVLGGVDVDARLDDAAAAAAELDAAAEAAELGATEPLDQE